VQTLKVHVHSTLRSGFTDPGAVERVYRRFLLGSALEHDNEEIGVRLIADAYFAERLDHAENELVEDYLDGLLSVEETRLFRENFLISPERLELLREVRLLRAGVRGVPQPAAEATGAASKTLKQSFFSFFLRPLPAVAGMVAVLFAGIFVWYTLLRDNRTPLEIEYTALNRRDLADAAKTGRLSVISLVPANFRDTAATAGHGLSGLTDAVVFRLALPVSEAEGTEMEASIERSGSRMFTVPGRVFTNPYGSELRFLAPKEILRPGPYEIEVRSARQANTTYQLRIE
jgi:hypothetical protein